MFLFLSSSTAPQRNFHLRTAISQLNDLLYSRMLSKGHSSDNPDSVYQGDSQGRLTAHMVPPLYPSLPLYLFSPSLSSSMSSLLFRSSLPPLLVHLSLPFSFIFPSLSRLSHFSSLLPSVFSVILIRPLILFQWHRWLSRCPLLPHTVYTSLSSTAVTKCCAFFRYFHSPFLPCPLSLLFKMVECDKVVHAEPL